MNKLKDFFAASRTAVDRALDELIPNSETEPKRLFAAIRWSVFAGGKRFRPALAFAAGQTFGAPPKKLARAAAAIEMIHAYSLIHDDLPAMDDDRLRRGRETCHIKFDEATAILAGDRLQMMAFQAIAADAGLPPEIRVKIINELADAAARMVDGQHLDLEAEGKTVTVGEIRAIHQNKTGAMISVAAHAGAIIAEANEKEFKAISNYASSLGLLFQITDDLLDVTQTTEILGKTAGKDISAEKATYPAFYGIEETRKLAAKVHAEAIDALSRVDRNTDLLKDLVTYILQRQK